MLHLHLQSSRCQIHKSTWIWNFYPNSIRHLTLKPSFPKLISQVSPKPKDGRDCDHWNSALHLAQWMPLTRVTKGGDVSLQPFSQGVSGHILATVTHLAELTPQVRPQATQPGGSITLSIVVPCRWLGEPRWLSLHESKADIAEGQQSPMMFQKQNICTSCFLNIHVMTDKK